jgi:isopenicillin N synthase-like dioxygenase
MCCFYEVVEKVVLPLLLSATSKIAGSDLALMHAKGNNNLRLVDYFPASSPSGPRCGEHRDNGTFTIVFQDGAVGGLEFEVDGRWVQLPANVDAVVSWGWCGAILSDDGVKAAKHRVLRTKPVQKRRTTAVVFVAPDLDAVLKPVSGGKDWSKRIMEGGLKVGEFKEVISKKWRRREGNEKGEVIEGGQDLEVEAFVRD